MAVETEKDSQTRGAFEVELDGDLIHSKLTRGDGRCEKEEENAELIATIRAAL